MRAPRGCSGPRRRAASSGATHRRTASPRHPCGAHARAGHGIGQDAKQPTLMKAGTGAPSPATPWQEAQYFAYTRRPSSSVASFASAPVGLGGDVGVGAVASSPTPGEQRQQRAPLASTAAASSRPVTDVTPATANGHAALYVRCGPALSLVRGRPRSRPAFRSRCQRSHAHRTHRSIRARPRTRPNTGGDHLVDLKSLGEVVGHPPRRHEASDADAVTRTAARGRPARPRRSTGADRRTPHRRSRGGRWRTGRRSGPRRVRPR